MIQIVLGIIAIGLALYLWERFPAFKWVLAALIVVPVVIVVGVATYENKIKADKEKEEAEFNLRYEKERKESEKLGQIESYENLKNLKEKIDKKIKDGKYENTEQMAEDINASKQLELWMSAIKERVVK